MRRFRRYLARIGVAGIAVKKSRFCPSIFPQSREHRVMSRASPTPDLTPLRLRRVRYQTDTAPAREGVVTHHDLANGMVTVLDTDDGSFWHGPELRIEIIA